MSDSEIQVLLFCKDLLFTSQLHGIVKRAGLNPRTCLSQRAGLEQLSQHQIQWVIADLELPDLELNTLREACGEQTRLVVFGPHVKTELFEAAEQAGCNRIMTKGQVINQLERALAG